MLGRLVPENRAISFQTIWGAGDLTAYETQAATFVDEQSATAINAVFACVTLISDTISTLPIDTFIRRDGVRIPYRPRPAWVLQPDVEINSASFWSQAMISLLLDGNAFIRVFRDPNTGDPINMTVLDPLKVSVTRGYVGQKHYTYQGEEGKTLSSDDILHITGSLLMPGAVRGESPVNKLRENFGLALALESFASRFFGQGTLTQGVIEFPGTLTQEQAKNLAQSFDNAHRGYKRAHKTGILSGGATFKPTMVANDQAQMLDSRRLAVEDIARAFRVPLNLIGSTERGAQSYNSNEQNAIAFVTHTLRPWISKLEDAFSRLLPERAFLVFNVDGLLRGDFATRVNGYASALQTGWLTINEVRSMEDLRPITEGDINRVPLANVNITAADLAEQEAKVAMAQKLIQAGFKPEDVLSAFALPPIPHTGIPTVTVQNPTQVPAGSYDVGGDFLPEAPAPTAPIPPVDQVKK